MKAKYIAISPAINDKGEFKQVAVVMEKKKLIAKIQRKYF